jgi:hypothetical protein
MNTAIRGEISKTTLQEVLRIQAIVPLPEPAQFAHIIA